MKAQNAAQTARRRGVKKVAIPIFLISFGCFIRLPFPNDKIYIKAVPSIQAGNSRIYAIFALPVLLLAITTAFALETHSTAATVKVKAQNAAQAARRREVKKITFPIFPISFGWFIYLPITNLT